jgi:hypothetical protein
MSAEDIDKGARWSTDIGKQLEQARVGIICLTKDNQHAPWIQFEAGALSKTLDTSFVTPYLLNVKPADLQGPLVQFQAAIADRADTLRLVRTINKALGDQALSETSIEKYFIKWWPELASTLAKIPAAETKTRSSRTDRDILEELLVLMRGLTREQVEQVLERDDSGRRRRRDHVGVMPDEILQRTVVARRGDELTERVIVRDAEGNLSERLLTTFVRAEKGNPQLEVGGTSSAGSVEDSASPSASGERRDRLL